MKQVIRVALVSVGIAFAAPATASHDCDEAAAVLAKEAEKMQAKGVKSRDVTDYACGTGKHPPRYISCLNDHVSEKTHGTYKIVDDGAFVYMKKVQ